MKTELYKLGRHRLICGDSTDPSVIKILMEGQKSALVLADPPYGMKKESSGIENDNLNFRDLLKFNRKWIDLSFESLKNNGSWYCWGTDEPIMQIYNEILRPKIQKGEITFRNLITWDKGSAPGQLSGDLRKYTTADEKCLFCIMGEQGFNNNGDNYFEGWEPIRSYLEEQKKIMGWTNEDIKRITGVSTVTRHCFSRSQFKLPTEVHYNEMREACRIGDEYKALKREYDDIKREFYDSRAFFDNTHDNMNSVWHFPPRSPQEYEDAGRFPTIKPINLCSRIIKSSSRENDIVMDPFGGSGSTLIACEGLNRTCYMVEIIDKHCRNIVERWQRLTGQRAVMEMVEIPEKMEYIPPRIVELKKPTRCAYIYFRG